MSSQPQEEWKRRIQDLKSEINSFYSDLPQGTQLRQNILNQVNSYWNQYQTWFQGLSTIKKSRCCYYYHHIMFYDLTNSI